MENIITLEALKQGVAELPTHAFPKIVTAIAKKNKKKTIKSGNMFFRDYCNLIAETLYKPQNSEILANVVVTYREAFDRKS